jgi:hypothetical protein
VGGFGAPRACVFQAWRQTPILLFFPLFSILLFLTFFAAHGNAAEREQMRQQLGLFSAAYSCFSPDTEVQLGTDGEELADFLVKGTKDINRASLIGGKARQICLMSKTVFL